MMMPDSEQPEEVTKYTYRQSTWELMKSAAGSYPAGPYKPRIPNFKGADEAARRLTDLPEFKNAKVIKLNPDKPQEPVKILSLEAGKEILIPIPRLKSGPFLHVTPPADGTQIDVKALTSRQELSKYGEPLGIDAKMKVDLVVIGAVCVSRLGYRIGKGEGFADLDFAILTRMGAVSQDTVVVTTVHDCQIIDDLPPRLFEKHDVPVDIIVTPTQTIYVSQRLRKPDGIFWDILTMRRVKSMQILQQLKELDEKEGKEIILKPDDPKSRRRRFDKNFMKKLKEKKRSKSESKDKPNDDKDEKGKENEEAKGRGRRRQGRSKKTEKSDSPANENNEKLAEKPRRKQMKYRPKADIDFSLKLSNIGSDVRVRDLKNALTERGVRPTDITWRGHRGFCYLHFGKLRNKNSVPNQPVQVDSIVANLQQLRIGEIKNIDNEFIIVEPAKPITRIEITDVTAV